MKLWILGDRKPMEENLFCTENQQQQQQLSLSFQAILFFSFDEWTDAWINRLSKKVRPSVGLTKWLFLKTNENILILTNTE